MFVKFTLDDGCFVDDLCDSSSSLEDLYSRRELLRHGPRNYWLYACDQCGCLGKEVVEGKFVQILCILKSLSARLSDLYIAGYILSGS